MTTRHEIVGVGRRDCWPVAQWVVTCSCGADLWSGVDPPPSVEAWKFLDRHLRILEEHSLERIADALEVIALKH